MCTKRHVYFEWRETLSHDNNYNISQVINFHNFTKHIIKLTQVMMRYIIVSEVNALKSTVTGTDRPLDTLADETKSPTAKKDKWQPSLWKQQLLNIYEMRRCRDAPVDTMGCDRISDQNAEPKVLVVFRVAVLRA